MKAQEGLPEKLTCRYSEDIQAWHITSNGKCVAEISDRFGTDPLAAELVRRWNSWPTLVSQLVFVLTRAEEMGCNCATTEQVNRGHNRDCPANQRNSLFKGARAALKQAEAE